MIILISLLYTQLLRGQTQTPDDVVYLSNGIIIHGMIIYEVPNKKISILKNGTVYMYKWSEVLNIIHWG